jgi:hypothetical protein
LSSITCFPHASWVGYPPAAEPGFDILSGILKAFLESSESRTDQDSGAYQDDPFVWEKVYKLKRVSVRHRFWEVASNFVGKGPKGAKQPEDIVTTNGRRRVKFRNITGTIPVHIHVGYDPEFTWVKKVSDS